MTKQVVITTTLSDEHEEALKVALSYFKTFPDRVKGCKFTKQARNKRLADAEKFIEQTQKKRLSVTREKIAKYLSNAKGDEHNLVYNAFVSGMFSAITVMNDCDGFNAAVNFIKAKYFVSNS